MYQAAEAGAEMPSYNMHVFPKAWTPTLPAIVDAPIVVDARTQEGVKDLLDYIRTLSGHNNKEVAAEEDKRLRPYFSSMSVYLTRALEKADPAKISGAERDNLAALTTPQGLSKLFNAMADYSRVTMISDVVIMPDNIQKTGPAAHLFAARGEFNTDYNYLGRLFNFGFLQAFEGGEKKTAKSGTTFPTFTVDHKMIDALPAAEAAPLIRGLQGVMTLVNHDMLHHFTATIIGGNTVYKTDKTRDNGYGGGGDHLMNWMHQLPTAGYSSTYEEWAQLGQEKILAQPESAGMTEDLRAKLDGYMDGLERVRDALLAPDGTGAVSPGQLSKAHEVVDYFGMVMAHGLTRAFPLNDPMMQHCLERLQKADSAPEQALEDCARLLTGQAPQEGASRAKVFDGIRNSLDAYGEQIPAMIKSYRALGCDVLPESDNDAGYKNFKMLQLMKLGGLKDHAPGIEYAPLKKLRENMDDLTLDMVRAAAKVVGVYPASPAASKKH